MKPTNFSILLIILLFNSFASSSNACTIFSGKDKNGHTWAGNNEDGVFNFKTYLNVYPSTCDGKYSYITFSYDSPENGANNNAQGGTNEAGLFFDFNALDMFNKTYVINNIANKKHFPGGDHEVFDHIMSNFETVQEVIDFFEEYWFEIGFNTAQMHLADKYGNFGMINATGSRLLKENTFQVSTNFSIIDKEDGAECWRFPIATEILSTEGVGLESFTKASKNTAQSDWATTIYSNVQNLSTGDLTLYYALDYDNPYNTNLKDLFAKGQKSYLMMDLFPNNNLTKIHNTFRKKGATEAVEAVNALTLDDKSRVNLLHNLMMPLVYSESNLEITALLDEFLASNPVGYLLRLNKALKLYYDGDIAAAKGILKAYKTEIPDTSLDIDRIINMMDGKGEEEANVNIKLEDYGNAKSVMIKGFPGSPQLFFLTKQDGVWVGNFKLNTGIYHYSYIVDGVEILDGNSPVVNVGSLFSLNTSLKHRLCIGFSEEMYQRTIRVSVPNKTDEVYIAGNQSSLTNWNSLLRLSRISDYEREIVVNVHFPAVFKFTKGNWETEAIIKLGAEKQEPFTIDKESKKLNYKVVGWKTPN